MDESTYTSLFSALHNAVDRPNLQHLRPSHAQFASATAAAAAATYLVQCQYPAGFLGMTMPLHFLRTTRKAKQHGPVTQPLLQSAWYSVFSSV